VIISIASLGLTTAQPTATAEVVNVKNEMTLAWEEIFGLVLSVVAYDSEEEAIAIANDSKAGRVVNNGMTDDPRHSGVDSITPAPAENIAGTGSRRFSNPAPSPRREGKH
jgi:hypothetical protein